jgi:5'-3' exonuclease
MSDGTVKDADLILVDGRNTLWRASYANNGLGYDGDDGWQPTGGVYGFLESVLAVAHRAKDAQIVVAWEGGKAARRAVVPTYKVRKPDKKREDLAKLVMRQEAILKGLLSLTNFDSIRAPKWEADDAMGAAAAAGYRAGLRVAILSTDADMLQCLRFDLSRDAWVRQLKPTKGVNEVWDYQRVLDEWGVRPDRVADVKALAGDTSDCYKGCPGIGQVWACKMIAEYGDIEGVITAANAGTVLGSEKKAEAIVANESYILDCYEVAVINTSARTIYTEGAPNRVALLDALTGLRFNTLRSAPQLSRMLR